MRRSSSTPLTRSSSAESISRGKSGTYDNDQYKLYGYARLIWSSTSVLLLICVIALFQQAFVYVHIHQQNEQQALPSSVKWYQDAVGEDVGSSSEVGHLRRLSRKQKYSQEWFSSLFQYAQAPNSENGGGSNEADLLKLQHEEEHAQQEVHQDENPQEHDANPQEAVQVDDQQTNEVQEIAMENANDMSVTTGGGEEAQDRGPVSGDLGFVLNSEFPKHRLGIVVAAVLAKELNVRLTFPDSSFCLKDSINECVYQHDLFITYMQENGVEIVNQDLSRVQFEQYTCPISTESDLHPYKCFDHLKLMKERDEDNFKLEVMNPEEIGMSRSVVRKHKQFVKGLLENLQLDLTLQLYQKKVTTRFQMMFPSKKFNVIQIDKDRFPEEGIQHIEKDTPVTYSYPEHIMSEIQNKKFDPNLPVYIWGDQQKTWSSKTVEILTKSLSKAGYKRVLDNALFVDADIEHITESYGTVVSYFISLRAENFLGDGNFLDTQMIMLERQLHGQWTSYYDSTLWLEARLPLFNIPWVFTHNDWSEQVEYMVKAAVISALEVADLTAYCMFTGDPEAPIVAWLNQTGVQVIVHQPAWVADLLIKNDRAAEYKEVHSHLYGTPEGLIATWLRIDLPILPYLNQYRHILYTDTDMYFRKGFSFYDMPQPMPATLGMGGEILDIFPYNAGIAIMNLENLRYTHSAFLDFIMTSNHSLFFPDFGPGDQGALNQFYEVTIKQWKLPKIFNAKPYHDYLPDSYLVHFHGPKPFEYLEYALSGNCKKIFTDLIKMGYESGTFCTYAKEWVGSVRDDERGQKLHDVCEEGNFDFSRFDQV